MFIKHEERKCSSGQIPAKIKFPDYLLKRYNVIISNKIDVQMDYLNNLILFV